ncbi:MAG TPA: DUF72 domain-containing protein [Pyrinomonadaceae bacterium]|nr:DUF72 domain-containing protein [Pyrinomonadaceae bacterium]
MPDEESDATTTRLPASSRAHIGCQGWNYDDWVTAPAAAEMVFYPRGTRPAAMLGIYTRAFETVEVDSTFYAVPSAATVDGWHKRTPPRFTFALKLPQQITHESGLRFKASADLLAEFCDHARLLHDKLAAVLIQLPPQFEPAPENLRALETFLPRLPRDLPFTVEFRHPAWITDEVLNLLASHRVPVTLVEGQWIARRTLFRTVEQMDADFAYIRFMGARDLTRFAHIQRPQDANLQLWAQAITRLTARVPRVLAYFSNYYEGHAPASANKLKQLLNQPITPPAAFENQPSLF